MKEPMDVEALAKQLVAGKSVEEMRTLVGALMRGQAASLLEGLAERPVPVLPPVPEEVRGFRVRLDLHGAKPPVWRRLELPGNLTLPRVHDVIQAVMGWYDSHLHRFRTGRDHRSPHFLTHFDLEEGEEGLLEDEVRLDQVVAARGDELWYEYDFGDGWDHRLVVEEVLPEPPATVRCVDGRNACPPEDCGGLGGYEELAAWVRSGYDDERLPDGFDDAEHARDWLPLDWHPDHFDVAETNAALEAAVAEPVAVDPELAELVEELDRRGIRVLRGVLARPASHGSTQVSDADAARLTEPLRVLLDVVGDGVALTAAGYLPPAVVEQVADRAGVLSWWIGKANREDLTPPVAQIRATARSLGLVAVRKGRLSPTAAGTRCRQDPRALWRHIVGRLPLGTQEAERQAGWMALAVAGSEAPEGDWRGAISDLMMALGWRSGRDPYLRPSAHSPTLDVLTLLAGEARDRRPDRGSFDQAVAATARAVVRGQRGD